MSREEPTRGLRATSGCRIERWATWVTLSWGRPSWKMEARNTPSEEAVVDQAELREVTQEETVTSGPGRMMTKTARAMPP